MDGSWRITVEGVGTDVEICQDGRRFVTAGHHVAVVDKSGTAVALIADGKLPLDDSWKGSPMDAASVSADQMNADLATLEQHSNQSLLRVALSFRSPRSGGENH